VVQTFLLVRVEVLMRVSDRSGEPSHAAEHMSLQDNPKGVTISTLSGIPKYYTFRVRGIL
jgi:hypothetical protein